MQKTKVLPLHLRVASIVLIPALLLTRVPVQALAQDSTTTTADSTSTSTTSAVKVNRTVPDVAPPQPFTGFSATPTDAEISAVHLLPEPLVVASGSTLDTNSLLARALEAFAQRTNSGDCSAIVGFLQAHPQTGWDLSLWANVGTVYFKSGQFSKALDAWEQAWRVGKSETDPSLSAIADYALGQLAKMNARIGRFDRLETLFQESQGRQITGPATQILTGAAEGLWLMKNRPDRAFLCGPMAVGTIFHLQNPNRGPDPSIHDARSTQNGTSLTQVRNLATTVGLKFQMAKRDPGAPLIVPAIVNWKVGHFAALVQRQGQRTLIEDQTFGERIWISDDVIDTEASGYFLVPAGDLPAGWRTVEDAEGDGVWGKGNTGSTDDDNDKPCDETTDGGCAGCNEGGSGSSDPVAMAVARAHLAMVSLNINDTPVYYDPPKGPAIRFVLTYNQRDVNQPATFSYSNLGPKWTFNWLSYVVDDSTIPGADARIYVQGGGAQTFTGYNSTTEAYAPELTSQAVLVRTSASSYELREPDGSKEVFNVSDGTVGAGRKIFLKQTVDPSGNMLTFTYDGSLRIVSVTDALGQVTTLSYTLAGDSRKVTKLTDPFGRFASFEYTNGHLSKITDMIGIVSQFEYDGDFVRALTTPYGISRFSYADISTDPRLNSRTRWLEMTDPMGGKQRVEFNELGTAVTGIPESDPPNTLPTGMYLRNSVLWARDTFYWDKKAMMDAPGDYSKARLYHWLHYDGYIKSGGILESEKKPLENRVWYNYPGQQVYQPGDPQENETATLTGTMNMPTITGRVLDDGSTQLSKREYNAIGNLTKAVDPAGRVTTYTYDANDIDVLGVYQQNPAGTSIDSYGVAADKIAAYTYNLQHRRLTITDAAGQTKTLTYNAVGQISTSTVVRNGVNETTTRLYDANGYLQSVTGPIAGSSVSYTYDSYGRVRTIADSEGYVLTFDYDNLNRVTKITYPDGTYQQTIYYRLDPQWRRDRLGRWTHLFYDGSRRLVQADDAAGRSLKYDWCVCGALHGLTDGAGHTTHFVDDIQGRLTQITYDDGKALIFTYENTTSRVKKRTDAHNRVKNYQYFADGQLAQFSYTDNLGQQLNPPTQTVSFTYDTNYARVATMTDGTGTTNYGYYAVASGTLGAGRLSSVDGPLLNDTVTYGYNELGRVTTQSINGVSDTLTLDALGRLTAEANTLGNFGYSYVNTTARMSGVTYPNGQTSTFSYYGNTAPAGTGNGDQRLQTILHKLSGGATLSEFDYAYDASREITSWTHPWKIVSSTLAYAQDEFAYDGGSQLLEVMRKDPATQTIQSQFHYGYDLAGNRTSEQVDTSVSSATYNNVNQLIGRNGSGPMVFEGNIDEPATVTVGGNPAKVTAVGNPATSWHFKGTATVSAGSQNVTIAATDASNNTRSYNANVSVTAGAATQALTYDSDGNLTDDGAGRTFAYDAENRLTKVTTGGHYEEFVYNGVGQRVARKYDGAMDKQWIWDHYELREERDASNNVTKRFFEQGEQIGGTNYYFTRDRLRSIREMTDSSGNVRARYDYDAWGRRTKIEGDLDADFSFTAHYWDNFASVNLTYYRAYDPDFGRWLSRDPIGIKGGVNLYDYVLNDPVLSKDPLGLVAAVDDDVEISVVIGVAIGRAIVATVVFDRILDYCTKKKRVECHLIPGSEVLVWGLGYECTYRCDDGSIVRRRGGKYGCLDVIEK